MKSKEDKEFINDYKQGLKVAIVAVPLIYLFTVLLKLVF